LKSSRLALLVLLGLTALVALLPLGSALIGWTGFVPFNPACWAPWAIGLSPSQKADLKAGANMDISEKTFLVQPELEVARRELGSHRLPYWNPYIRNGGPLLHHSLDGLLHPPHWLLLLMSPERAFAFLALFAFLMAALFTFLLLRIWDLHPLAALGGGVLFAFSGPMMANAHFFMRQDTLVFLPGLLWAFEKWRRQEGAMALLSLSLTSAGLWLAGFPSFAVAFTIAMGIWVGWHIVTTLLKGKSKSLVSLLIGSAIGLILGLMLAAPQLLPLASYLPWSQRTEIALNADLRTWGADPAVLLTSLIPDLFGSPASSEQVSYLQSPMKWLLFCWTKEGLGVVSPFNFTESAIYVGALPLLLALWGLVRPWPGRRGPLLFLGIVTLALALGLEGGRITAVLPGLQRAGPLRLLPLFSLVTLLFAARGLHLFLKGGKVPRRVLLTGVILFLLPGLFWLILRFTREDTWCTTILAALSRKYTGSDGTVFSPEYIEKVFLHRHILLSARSLLLTALLVAFCWWTLSVALLTLGRTLLKGLPRLFTALCILVALADLLHFGLPLCPSFQTVDPFSGTALHRSLATQRDLAAPKGGIHLARIGPGPGSPPTLFPPNLPTGMGIRDLNCYAFVDRRSHSPLARAWRTISPQAPPLFHPKEPWFGALPDSELLTHPILDLYGVTHLLAERIPEHGKFRTLLQMAGPGGQLFLLERLGAAARARIVPEGLPLPDDQALARLADPSFDPDALLFLPPGTPPVKGGGGGSLTFHHHDPSRIVINIKDTAGGVLFLADTYTTEWVARLDGSPHPIWRGNTCFMALSLPPGDHQVEITLPARPFWWGLFLAVLAATLLVIGCTWLARRKRPHRGEEKIL